MNDTDLWLTAQRVIARCNDEITIYEAAPFRQQRTEGTEGVRHLLATAQSVCKRIEDIDEMLAPFAAAPPAQPASQADEPRCPDCGVRVPRNPALATEHVTHSAPTPAASSGLAAEFGGVMVSSSEGPEGIAAWVVTHFEQIQAALALEEAIADPDDAMVERVALAIAVDFGKTESADPDDYYECLDDDGREEWRATARVAIKVLSEGQQR